MKLQAPSLPPSAPPAAPAPAATQRAATPQAAPAGACAQLRCTHSDFDAARVAALREQVQNGSYQPRLDKVADGMLAHLQGLASGGRA